MPTKKYRDTYTNRVYEVPWNEDREPDDDEIESLINVAKRKSSPTVKQEPWWNRPLTTVASKTAKKTANTIDKPSLFSSEHPWLARAKGFAAGATEGLGDLVDSFTTPLDLASTALTLGGGTAVKMGFKGAGALKKGASALSAGRGAYNMYHGLEDSDPAKFAMGSIEALAGTHGLASKPKLPDFVPDKGTFHGPVNKPDHSAPIGPNRPTSLRDRVKAKNTTNTKPGQKQLGTGTTFKAFGDFLADARNNPDVDSKLVKEAERYGMSQDDNGRILSRRTVFSGDGKLPDIDVKPIKSEVVPKSIGEKTKSKVKDLIHIDEQSKGGGAEAAAFEKDLALDSGSNSYTNMDEKVLNILKKNGDKGAIKELAKRKGETGSVASDILTGAFKGATRKVKDTVNLNMINSDSKVVQKLKPAYQKWVNDRAARKGVSFNVKKDFQDLEGLGLEGVHAFNAGERGGRLADVQKWFDEMHNQVSKSGIKLGFKENYLPQIWDNSKEEIAKVFGNKKLTLKPGIAFKSIIDTYKSGMEKGLTPKYKSIPDLMGYYSEVANKAVADREFFKFLRENKLISTKSARKSKGWKPLEQDIFPVVRTKDKNILEWHAPPEVHAIIDNYLSERGDVAKSALRGIQLTKDVAMASGLPGTAFNAHGFNMLRRSATVNGVKGFTKALGHMINPGSSDTKGLGSKISATVEKYAPWKSADTVINENRQLIPDIMKHGGRLGVEGHQFNDKLSGAILGKAANKLTDWHRDLFETHLFDKMIPALKIDYYKSSVDDLLKTGMAEVDAKKQAARAMNLAFAGVNYDELATNKNLLDISRAFFLAPDWYASNIGLAKNVVHSFLNSDAPGAKLYRQAGKGLIGAYATATVANKIMSGKFMHENDSGRSLDIDTGTYTMNDKGEKKKVYISPFGTAFDAIKIPISILNEIYKDVSSGQGSPVSAGIRPLKNRLSLPAHSAVNLLSNTDDFGRRIYGRDTYGNDLPPLTETKNLSRELSSPLTPAYAKGLFGGMTGSMSPLEATSQSIEAPLTFTRQSMPRKGRKQKRRKK